MGVCALRAGAARTKHQVRVSSRIDIGRFTQEPAETCPLTHSPKVLPIGPVASTVVTIRRLRPVNGRAGQLLLLGSARLPVFFKTNVLRWRGKCALNLGQAKPNLLRTALCAVLIQLHLAGRLDPCNQPQEPL